MEVEGEIDRCFFYLFCDLNKAGLTGKPGEVISRAPDSPSLHCEVL